MSHFVQYLNHLIFILLSLTLVVPCLHNMFMVLLIFALGNIKIGATKPIFFNFLVSLEGRRGRLCVCGHGLLSLHSSYPKIQVKTLFSLALTAICAELCCQTTWGHIPLLCAKLQPLEKALKKQNNGQSVLRIWVLNACIWLARTNTQNLYAIYTPCILPVTMTCAVLCWWTYLGMYSSAFCHIWALK